MEKRLGDSRQWCHCLRHGRDRRPPRLVLLLARSDRSAERARETVEAVGERAPARVDQLIEEGAVGRKSGRGFFGY